MPSIAGNNAGFRSLAPTPSQQWEKNSWRRAVPSPSISSPFPNNLHSLEPKCREPKAGEWKELGGKRQTITKEMSSAPLHPRQEQKHRVQQSSGSAQHKAKTLPGSFVSDLSRASLALIKVSRHKRRQANTVQDTKREHQVGRAPAFYTSWPTEPRNAAPALLHFPCPPSARPRRASWLARAQRRIAHWNL